MAREIKIGRWGVLATLVALASILTVEAFAIYNLNGDSNSPRPHRRAFSLSAPYVPAGRFRHERR